MLRHTKLMEVTLDIIEWMDEWMNTDGRSSSDDRHLMNPSDIRIYRFPSILIDAIALYHRGWRKNGRNE